MENTKQQKRSDVIDAQSIIDSSNSTDFFSLFYPDLVWQEKISASLSKLARGQLIRTK